MLQDPVRRVGAVEPQEPGFPQAVERQAGRTARGQNAQAPVVREPEDVVLLALVGALVAKRFKLDTVMEASAHVHILGIIPPWFWVFQGP